MVSEKLEHESRAPLLSTVTSALLELVCIDFWSAEDANKSVYMLVITYAVKLVPQVCTFSIEEGGLAYFPGLLFTGYFQGAAQEQEDCALKKPFKMK